MKVLVVNLKKKLNLIRILTSFQLLQIFASFACLVYVVSGHAMSWHNRYDGGEEMGGGGGGMGGGGGGMGGGMMDYYVSTLLYIF